MGSSEGLELINLDESIEFLNALWGLYSDLRAQCYSVVVMSKGVSFKHFCINEYGDYHALFKAVKTYLAKIVSEKIHVYFQVLPLTRRPETGRGTSRDVEIGRWMWCDLDYKEAVENPEFTECNELEDHALECYYQDGDKWIHVSRPPLSEVLKTVEEKLGFKPTIVVDSGAGYHLYFKLSYEIEASELARLEAKLVDLLGGDPQSKDLARILRLPGSINPRVSRLVKVIHYEPSIEIDPEELEQKLEGVKEKKAEKEEPKPGVTQLRELSDTEILRIVELLKEAYRPGYRQSMLLYLGGWLAKAKISPLSAVKIAKHLYESTQDEDPLKTRLGALVYSYKKAGIDVDSYASEIENLTGIKPYGLEREINESRVKGRLGLQEILEEALGEENALGIIHELSELLQCLSPYRDSIIEIIDYEKQLYAVANLRKLLVVRARKRKDPVSQKTELVYKEKVAVVAPTKITVYRNPLGGVTKYEVTFEGSTLQKPLTVGPATIDEIADRLKIEGLVYNSRLINDVLSAIIQAYIRRGRAEIKTEIESPGFYLVEGKVVAVRYEVRQVDKSRLKEALETLNELAETWFKHVKDKFATVIKWGAIAPFTFILKARGVMQKYLYLYGDSATGKTTLGRIVLRMWGLDSRHEKTGASIDTTARLGFVLSQSTFPTLINEPGGALIKEDVVETIKNASEGLTARGKYVKGTYIDYPALAPLVFTSNKFLPRDDALLRRFIIITFSYGEKIPKEKQGEFKEKIEPRLHLLKEIGVCISNIVVNNSNLLNTSNDILALGEMLLAKCYEVAGLEKPQWLGLIYEEEDGPQTFIVEEFIERFKKYINDLYARYVSRVVEISDETLVGETITPDRLTIANKLKVLLEKNMIPGMILKESNSVVVLGTLLKELGLNISLKSLGEMLGFEYKVIKIKGNVVKGLEAPLENFTEFFISTFR